MQITQTAVEDFRAIFSRQGYTNEEAHAQLERDLPKAKLHFSKRNGAEVYRASGSKDRYYLLINDGRVCAIGPPSEDYKPGPSFDRWEPRPGEDSPVWWRLSEGDVEAPRERPVEGLGAKREGLGAKRERAHPIVAEVRELAEEAGWTQRMVGERLGGLQPRTVKNWFTGHTTNLRPEQMEAWQKLAEELRRVLGKKRPTGRPSLSGGGVSAQLGGRVRHELAEWVKERGGWDFVRDLLEREYSDFKNY